jgi:hypothetical protein
MFFIFFPPHFLKTNAKHSRAPQKRKPNKRVILASPQTANWLLPQHTKPTLQAKSKEPFFCQHALKI